MPTLSASEKKAILARIRKLVLQHHINVSNIDYEAWAKEFDAKSPELVDGDRKSFESGVAELLAELKTSHTSFFHAVPDRLLPQHTLNATLRKVVTPQGERWMFVDIFEDGAAHRSSIRPGQILLAIDNAPVAMTDTPRFGLGKQYKFTVANGDKPDTASNVTIQVPFLRGTKANPPIVPPKTIAYRMLRPGLGYLRIGWFTASMGLGFAKELDRAIAALKSAGCEALVVDLRGNIGGGLGLARLASYLTPSKIAIGQSLTPKRLRLGFVREELPKVPMPSTALGLLLALARFLVKDKSLVLLTQGLGVQPFHGRVAILVNEFTSSAAEMVANFASENKLATVIGTQTGGTVLGARNIDVGSGYWLRLPVFGWFTSNGRTIENVGVTPDIRVDASPEALRNGIDEQLNTATKLLMAKTL
jgi:C-terminal processing protease CtpA/Prc